MTTILDNRAVLIVMAVLAAFNAILTTGNGLVMIVAPQYWYESVPGVIATGFFNQHFIRDIGFIYFLIGLAFGIGWFRPAQRAGLWGVATLWLGAHALFHFWEVAVGICGPSALARDFFGVTSPALIGVLLTYWAIQHSRARRA
mgnify:CR=1 FL=1|tara:strand:- start:184981 stop:185412 length:432 start_codon:yes stop_codon:yes gene_type:complete